MRVLVSLKMTKGYSVEKKVGAKNKSTVKGRD